MDRCDFTAQTQDLITIVEWIVDQPWSNGNMAAEGVSYEGSTAEMLVRLGHPAVKLCTAV